MGRNETKDGGVTGLSRTEAADARDMRDRAVELLREIGDRLGKEYADRPVGFVFGFGWLERGGRSPLRNTVAVCGDETVIRTLFHGFLTENPDVALPAYRLYMEEAERNRNIASLADPTIS